MTESGREISDGECREVLQELGAIEVQLESLKERRQELINELREDGLVGVRVTPVGDKIRNSIERQGNRSEEGDLDD